MYIHMYTYKHIYIYNNDIKNNFFEFVHYFIWIQLHLNTY